MTISKELLDELLSGVERPEDLLGDKGLMKELKVRLAAFHIDQSQFTKSQTHPAQAQRVGDDRDR